MQIRALSELFVRGREEGEYVHPGAVIELEDGRAQRLIDMKHAEAVSAKDAAKAAKEGGS